MGMWPGKKVIVAGQASTFASTPIPLGTSRGFDIRFLVASGATATFTLVDEDNNAMNGAVSLTGLTANKRLSFSSDEFHGPALYVACTSYSGTGNVGVILEFTE